MKQDGFTACANAYIKCLQEEGRFATANVYSCALRSFTRFSGTKAVSFSQVTRTSIKQYGNYLKACNLKLNTISTYARMLRCIYNKGVDSNKAPYVHHMFRDVFTGVETRQKKAIPLDELHTLLHKDPQSEKLRRTQSLANLLFLFSGMPFVDLAHLEKINLEGRILKYYRAKTGTPMNIEILDSAVDIISRLCNHQSPAHPGQPDYLFYIMSGKNKRNEEAGYKEYQSALRRFNNDLKSLAGKLGIRSAVTSYTFRHSWATTAKYRGVPIEMISESLGHKSIKTTQIYLKGFELEERTKVNRLNYSYVKSYKGI